MPKSFAYAFILFTLFTSIFFSCSHRQPQTPFADLSGPYLGQTPPSDTAELFAPGILSNAFNNRDMAISPDGSEIYTSVVTGGFAHSKIIVYKNKDGFWQPPEIASFCGGPETNELEPAFSYDGSTLFFISNRTDSINGKTGDHWDIWAADRTYDGWGEPYNLGGPVNSDHHEFFPSLTKDGTLYFTRRQADSRDEFIYRSRKINGSYMIPERLPDQVNCGQARYNAFVARDESYIIVPVFGMPDSYGGTDYYITFRNKEDQWSRPVNLGAEINSSAGQEWSPYITHDEKYFFFMSMKLKPLALDGEFVYQTLLDYHNNYENGLPDMYWIEASFIKALRPEGF